MAAFSKRISDWREERRRYFSFGKEEIDHANLVMLFQVSFLTMLLTALLIFVATFIFTRWEPLPAHIILVPVSAAFCLVSMYLRKRPTLPPWLADLLCTLFMAALLALLIPIDCQYSDGESTFFPLVAIALPALFTLRFAHAYSVIGVFSLIYVRALFVLKAESMARQDLFTVLVSLLISLLVGDIIVRLRAENYQSRREYKQLSMTDGLTGIMNKVNCEAAVQQHLASRENDEICALLVLDVDDFKHVNDTMGHQAGDEVLGSFAALLGQTFRSSDIVGRIGGDEFMVMMRGLPGEEVIHHKCAKLFGGVDELSARMNYKLTCSIGVALLTGETVDFDGLFQIADDALYEAKATGKARVALHAVHETAAPAGQEKPLMLIADDNEMNRVILRAALQEDYHIVEADSGTATLEQVGRYRDQLDMILLDLVMPDIDGYTILKYIKSRTRLSGIPVVVITADNRSEKDVLQLGAADMIAKPFDAEVVQIRVHNALRPAVRAQRLWEPKVSDSEAMNK